MYICNCCSAQIIILEKGYAIDYDKNPIKNIPVLLEKPIYICPRCRENSNYVEDIAKWKFKEKRQGN